MLVDKVFQEDGTMECLYKSSNILMSEYNEKTQKLMVTFNYGGVYAYHNVSYKDYLRFEADESQGKTFNKYIKIHKTDNLGKTDVSVMKERLERLLNNRKEVLKENKIDGNDD
jgi:hypothetical protein